MPYVAPAPSAGEGGRSQRSHAAHSHTSSPWAHRSQPDRWTLMMLRPQCVRRSPPGKTNLKSFERKKKPQKKRFPRQPLQFTPAVENLVFPPRQLFERAPPRLAFPCPGPEPVSLQRRSSVSPCRPDPPPSEAAEVTLSLRPPRVLWTHPAALSPCLALFSFPPLDCCSTLSHVPLLSASWDHCLNKSDFSSGALFKQSAPL